MIFNVIARVAFHGYRVIRSLSAQNFIRSTPET
jgi:hypothetical protein